MLHNSPKNQAIEHHYFNDRLSMKRIYGQDPSSEECYTNIFNYHKGIGIKTASVLKRESEEDAELLPLNYQKKTKAMFDSYFAIVGNFPSPAQASTADQDFVFLEIMIGSFSWSSECFDENGIRLIDYVKYALQKRYSNDQSDKLENYERASKNAANSFLNKFKRS